MAKEMITSLSLCHIFLISKKYYNITATDLSEQKVLDPNPKTIYQINFIKNLVWRGNTTMLFIIKEAKETIFYFSQGVFRVLKIYFALINNNGSL